jgi:hypothetical protein
MNARAGWAAPPPVLSLSTTFGAAIWPVLLRHDKKGAAAFRSQSSGFPLRLRPALLDCPASPSVIFHLPSPTRSEILANDARPQSVRCFSVAVLLHILGSLSLRHFAPTKYKERVATYTLANVLHFSTGSQFLQGFFCSAHKLLRNASPFKELPYHQSLFFRAWYDL